LTTSACGDAAVPANQATAATAPAPPAPATPDAVAQRLVRQQLGAAGSGLRFGAASIYTHDGVPVVCGSYAEAGRPEQRFVAVGDIDVWLEPNMQPGEMDRAFAEYCRDGAANA
jgi:hypothetical protein